MIVKVSHIIQMLRSVRVVKNFSEITQGHPTSKQFNRIFVCLISVHLPVRLVPVSKRATYLLS